MLIDGVSSIDSPRSGTVLYAESHSLLEKIDNHDEFAVIVNVEPSGVEGNFLVHPNPRVAFAKVSAYFNPPYWMLHSGISPQALIESGAFISESASVGAGAFVGSGAKIMENVRLLPNTYVGRGVVIGRNTVILPGAVILEGTKIGERVIVNSNAVIGSEGFGFVEDGSELLKVPQIGGVIIGDDVEIGASTTIDRGTIDDTVIDSGSKLDNLVQIGHNVRIGKNVRIAAQAGLSGRVQIDDNVIIGGQAGFQNGVKVGRNTTIAGQAAVFKSIPSNQVVSGYPAIPHGEALRLLAFTRRLPEIIERINAIEARINKKNE